MSEQERIAKGLAMIRHELRRLGLRESSPLVLILCNQYKAANLQGLDIDGLLAVYGVLKRSNAEPDFSGQRDLSPELDSVLFRLKELDLSPREFVITAWCQAHGYQGFDDLDAEGLNLLAAVLERSRLRRLTGSSLQEFVRLEWWLRLTIAALNGLAGVGEFEAALQILNAKIAANDAVDERIEQRMILELTKNCSPEDLAREVSEVRRLARVWQPWRREEAR
ncbi:hypothetical protein [Synechococcus sp. PCC 6312]|uniref:hypothetical protein n=1 Tax=Synechococcus sp. (strain ATCC 27167 / PCC 6312) TaxID=195253 RepID=UPI00029EDD6F|nr:hypothetical protein [Synechococcus sp. PCC 6312]AFY60338.1 hypothetical protein Syn6312_1149 [Synechococcus sp. PCC 6312]